MKHDHSNFAVRQAYGSSVQQKVTQFLEWLIFQVQGGAEANAGGNALSKAAVKRYAGVRV